jgi:hypothetical protein
LAVTNIFDLYMNQKETDYYSFCVNQGDYQSRLIQANLYITYIKGGSKSVYNLTDETVTITYEYTDSNGEVQNTSEFECTKATSIGNNVVTFIIPNTVLQTSGDVKAQVKVYEDSSTVLNSTVFLFCSNESLNVGLVGDTVGALFVRLLFESGAPTTSTVGSLGQLYTNTDNNDLYYCSAIIGENYTWTLFSYSWPSANLVSITDSGGYYSSDNVEGALQEVGADLVGKVDKSTFNANTILYATTDNTPVALTVAEQTVVGRTTGGNIAALAIDSDLTSVSANDDTIPSAKATKAALDGKVPNSLFDANTVLYATMDNTPSALTVAEQTVVGRLTGENIDDIPIGIADNNVVQIDHASVASGDFARFTPNGLEGRSAEEVLSDIGAVHTNMLPNWDYRFNTVNQRALSGDISSG